jgi:hypothetical protein
MAAPTSHGGGPTGDSHIAHPNPKTATVGPKRSREIGEFVGDSYKRSVWPRTLATTRRYPAAPRPRWKIPGTLVASPVGRSPNPFCVSKRSSAATSKDESEVLGTARRQPLQAAFQSSLPHGDYVASMAAQVHEHPDFIAQRKG